MGFFLYSLFRASSFYIHKIQQDATGAGMYYCKLTMHFQTTLNIDLCHSYINV